MKQIYYKFFTEFSYCTREDAIEALWAAVEDGTEAELLSYVCPPARLLEWLGDLEYRQGQYDGDYWLRNSLFALLILAAEGELE